MNQSALHITVEDFAGLDAICAIDESEYRFQLPIQKLPENITKGSELLLEILTPEVSRQQQAYAVLAAMLN